MKKKEKKKRRGLIDIMNLVYAFNMVGICFNNDDFPFPKFLMSVFNATVWVKYSSAAPSISHEHWKGHND